MTPRADPSPLTPREWEVVELLQLEFTDKEIARELGIGAETVKRHLSTIREKLDVVSRVGIAMRVNDIKQKREREQALNFDFQSN
jgi:DNA-binding NarL/FixJ family response regulator